MTPLGLLRQTTLPQGATNSVAQFVRVVTRILQDHIPTCCRPFLDDIGVKGPRTRYNEKEAVPGVRRFVLEHISWLDSVLVDLERAGCTISGEKSQFCMPGIKIVGFVCDSEGRRPDSSKVIKLLEWDPCMDVRSARAFIGLCVYYRIWIRDFAMVSEPIYRLFRRGASFEWGVEQDTAMTHLKTALTQAPALRGLDYSEGAGEIILAVDASLQGWGAILQQQDAETGKRHPCRYESGHWTDQEARYDAGKRECRGLLKALKKCRHYLYGVSFVVEIDADTLVAQLNQSAQDLPGALITRWLAWIRLFDFEVRHIPGRKHSGPDSLSRRPRTESDNIDEAHEEDIDDFIDRDLNSIRICPATLAAGTERILTEDYSDESEAIARFLTTLAKPETMDRKEFRKFKANALKFLVRDGHLFRKANKNMPLRRVVDNETQRQQILQELHEESGHRGREGTYRRIADRYWWEKLHKACAAHVKTCDPCQRRAPTRTEEALHPTWVSSLWEKVGVDIVHMPSCQGKNYLIMARDDLSGWVEGRAIASANSETVAKFLWEDVICRHSCFRVMVMDGGPENKAAVEELANKYGLKRIITSAYHPEGNGLVERGHAPIVNALSKMSSGGFSNWVRNLHAVLWADRTTCRESTGMTPYRMNYGTEAVLPVELHVPTWQTLPWDTVRTTEDLLALRARQLQRRDEDLEEARLHLRRHREANKELFDNTHRIQEGGFEEGDLVLLHDTKRDNMHNEKLAYRWLGPFRIRKAVPNKGYYHIEELNGVQFRDTAAGSRLKKYHCRPEPTGTERAAAENYPSPPPLLSIIVPPPSTREVDYIHR